MSCSPARLAANQRNALRSTGPRTVEGKERSRANAYKHGLTGEGVVLPEDEAAEVEALATQLEREMKPSGVMGRVLLKRVAVLSNRLDRCGEHEAAMTAKRVRDADKDRTTPATPRPRRSAPAWRPTRTTRPAGSGRRPRGSTGSFGPG